MSSRAAGLQGRKQLTVARSSRYVSNLIGIGLLYVERHLWAYLEDGAHTLGQCSAVQCRAGELVRVSSATLKTESAAGPRSCWRIMLISI